MLRFRIDDTFFTLRTAAVIVREENVLLHQAEGNNFWSLPGGRVEPMESTSDALRREINEELNVHISIVRLLWIIEYFYRDNGENNHEIGFYYRAELPEDCVLFDFSKTYKAQDGNTKLAFKWYPLQSLDSISLYPEFLNTALFSLPERPEFIVFRDPSLSDSP